MTVRRIPKYRKHASGQARVDLAGRTFYLGVYGSTESQAEYDRLIGEFLTRTGRFAPPEAAPEPSPDGPSVNEVILAYLRHAAEYYQRNPKEVVKIKLAVGPLKRLYGRSPAAKFDSVALEAVQEAMIGADLARTSLNERVAILKRMFKWAARKKMVPAALLGELLLVEGLKKYRTRARETKPVRPVELERVEAVLPHVTRHVAAMIRPQLLTGARSGELCIMRACDIDRTGEVWVYRPSRHKTDYRDQPRQIFLGPQAQEILKAFLDGPATAYLFSPRKAREERFADMRARRKTRVQPSQRDRRKKNPHKMPGLRYTPASYGQAIAKACRAAGVARWHPHQLRHAAATALRKQFGLETARIILGQRSLQVAERYAEVDAAQAVAVMQQVG